MAAKNSFCDFVHSFGTEIEYFLILRRVFSLGILWFVSSVRELKSWKQNGWPPAAKLRSIRRFLLQVFSIYYLVFGFASDVLFNALIYFSSVGLVVVCGNNGHIIFIVRTDAYRDFFESFFIKSLHFVIRFWTLVLSHFPMHCWRKFSLSALLFI